MKKVTKKDTADSPGPIKPKGFVGHRHKNRYQEGIMEENHLLCYLFPKHFGIECSTFLNEIPACAGI